MTQILFLGDSITDCDHSFDSNNLGYGYVKKIAEILGPTASLINKGIDGFTLSAVKRMWNQVNTQYIPDVISILVGINDIYMMETTKMDIPFALEEFKLSYKTLLESIRKKFQGPIILMEPFLFPYPLEYKNWFESLQKMNQIIQKTANEYHVTFVPLWDMFLNEMCTKPLHDLTPDGIHLTEYGHELLANEWLSAYETVKKQGGC